MTRHVFAIVGGGIAGLRISIFLKRLFPEWRIVLLEQGKRVGGRIYTHRETVGGEEVAVESGAGRIGMKQERVMKLLARYGLQEKLIPISNEVDIRRGAIGGSTRSATAIIKDLPEATSSFLWGSRLAGGSIEERVREYIGEAEAKTVRYEFEYDSEIVATDSAVAVETIVNTFRGKFAVLGGGLDQLTKAMEEDARKSGVEIHTRIKVVSIHTRHDTRLSETHRKKHQTDVDADVRADGESLFLRCKHLDTEKTSVLHARGVVVATPIQSLRKLLGGVVSEARVERLYGPSQLTAQPLLRIYAKFPTTKGKDSKGGTSWFSGVGKVATRKGIRYFLPVDASRGIAMVSYTDGAEAYAWESVRKEHGEDAAKRMLLEQLRELFPEKEIPPPEWFRMEFWKEGAHYWTPGADLRMKTMRERIHPNTEIPLYVTGEVISPLNQAWVEGALEMAEETANVISEGVDIDTRFDFDRFVSVKPTFGENTTTFQIKTDPDMRLISFSVYRFDNTTNEFVPAVTPGIRRRLINDKYKEDLRGASIKIYAVIEDTTRLVLDKELVKTIHLFH